MINSAPTCKILRVGVKFARESGDSMIDFPLVVSWNEFLARAVRKYTVFVWRPDDAEYSKLTEDFEPGALNIPGFGKPYYLAAVYPWNFVSGAAPLAAYAVIDPAYDEYLSIEEMIGVRCLMVGVTYTL